MAQLCEETYRLLNRSIAEGTRIAYQGAVNSFQQFRFSYHMDTTWPAITQQVMAFVARLSLDGRASSTVAQRLAALSYLHKLYGWPDPTKHFLIQKMQEGCKRGNKRKDGRLPITWALLCRLIPSLHHVCSSLYEVRLFQAAFLIAFFGFLRVGEFTVGSKVWDDGRALTLQDIQFGGGLRRSLLVCIRYSKTDQYGSASTLEIQGNGIRDGCPVVAMDKYLQMRPRKEGPLFCHANGCPLTRYQFQAVLAKALTSSGAVPSEYGTHSFRIGAATTAALNGFAPDKIKEMGRWRSEAYKLYVR